MTRIKIAIIAFISCFAVYLCVHIYDFEFMAKKSEKIYSQGLEFASQKDYQNAYYNFSKVPKHSKIGKLALFKKALVSDCVKDWPSSIKNYSEFIKLYPKTILTTKATYNLALAYYRNENFDKSIETFKLVQKKYPRTDFAVASNFYLGILTLKLDKNQKQQALQYFISYLQKAPDGRLCKNIISQIKKDKFDLSYEQKKIIGIASFENGNFNDSLLFLNELKKQDVWPYVASSLLETKQIKKGRELFEQGMQYYSMNVEKNLLYQTIENYVKSFDNLKAGWQNADKIAQKSNVARDFTLYNLTFFQDQKSNLANYKFIVDHYPKGDFASESLWELFWHCYMNKSYKSAKAFGKKHINMYANTKASGRMLFWMGKVSLLENDPQNANNFFKEVIAKYPNDYYAFRAYENLKDGKKSILSIGQKLENIQSTPQFPINYANLAPEDMAIVMKIVELKDYEMLEQIHFESGFVDSWIQYNLGNFAASANLARKAFEMLEVKPLFYDEVYKLIYPIHFSEKINNYNKKYNVNPFLILSIVKEESYFNEKAKSKVGAKGLMQLMPSTANFIAHKDHIYYNSLFNKEDNLKLGIAYLNYIIQNEVKNPILAVAAYNAGPGIVKVWQNKFAPQDIDEIVENIPYFETKHYVRKVFSSYWNYVNVYR